MKRTSKGTGFRGQGSGFAIALAIAFLFAFSLSCGAGDSGDSTTSSADDDDDNDDAGDDDDDSAYTNDDDDDTGGDDDETSCAIVWLECEYRHPWDSEPDECGEYPTNPTWEEYQAYYVCRYDHWSTEEQAIADCGMAEGCDDWKLSYHECRSEILADSADCYENDSDGSTWQDCINALPLMSICSDI